MENYGMVQVKGTQQTIDDELNKQSETNSTKETLVIKLNEWIDKEWTAAKEAKITIEQEMLNSIFQRSGRYSPEKLAQIRKVEQPEIFMNITETKCRNASAQIKDVLMQPGKMIFSVNPTPIPDLPEDIANEVQQGIIQMYIQFAVQQAITTGQQPSSQEIRNMIIQRSEDIKEKVRAGIVKKAKSLAGDIELKIDDDFKQGGFYDAVSEIVDDIVGLKAGMLKGPVFRKEKIKRSSVDPQTGKISKVIEEKIVPQYERRSPFYIYPSPRSTGVNNGYLFDVIVLKPKDLYNLIGVEGFDAKEIRNVIREFNNGELKNDWLGLSSEAKEGFGEEDSRKMSSSYPYENIYGLELWDDIPGNLLLEWGMSDTDIPDEDDVYSVCLWKIGNHVIKAMLNYDQLGRKPFGVTSYQKSNDSFWGRGIPEMIEDCQQVCNACARAILSNVGIASFPMLDLNVDRLEPGASRKIWPGRVFPTTDEQMAAGSRALNFYQAKMVTTELTNVYDKFSAIADEHSGIPAFEHGGNVGAAKNSSGLRQMREMAAQGIRSVIRNIDIDIIVNALEFHYDYLLDNSDIFGLTGDYHMVPEGSSALAAKEQQTVRKNEFLQATANPIDLQILGAENRRKLLFEVAKDLGIELDEEAVLPPQQVQQQIAPPPNAAQLDDAGQPIQGVDTRTESAQPIAGQQSM